MRLPRTVYWVLGAAIAIAGAVGGRTAAAAYPTYQVTLWLLGGAFVFIGLAVLSLGTRSRIGDGNESSADKDEDTDGAGGHR